MEKSNRAFSWGAWAGAALIAAFVLLLAGCFSLGGIGSAIGRSAAPAPAPAAQTQPAATDQTAAQTQPAPQAQPAPSAGATMAYQYQFGAFYSGFWSMGWFGYKDGNYKPGQGTIWKFTNTGRSSEPVTFERALLKVNGDSSQWWRFRVDTGKKTIMYEFLVGSDMVAKKVRYKDPDSGAVGEFVPSQDNTMPSQAPSNMPTSRADMAKYKVDSQNVTVQAGSFATDHYLYTDDASRGSAESWINEKVPGYMVKSVYTNKKNNQTSQGELIQIESGVTTSLGSY
jgi:hypothetical protein